ncbi:MAG: hypothetical protein OXB94_03065 [Nitrospira sp.]|nr:hypothetical protein [Nitrospira sp.]
METITLKQLADEIGVDRSNMRKIVIRMGISPSKIRSKESRNQSTLAVSLEEAEQIRQHRLNAGFSVGSKQANIVSDDSGVFYLISPDPHARPHRIKMGFTSSLDNRLKTYQTISPDAALISQYPCRKSWESAALYAIGCMKGCTNVSGELYDCKDIDSLKKRATSFFKFFQQTNR